MLKKNEKKQNDLIGCTNRIVATTIITGNIETSADFRLDGILTGDLNAKGRLVVGPKGVINGNVNCKNADIEGKIEGILQVEELLVLKATAVIEGDVIVGRLSVEPGAVFKASCKMNGLKNKCEKGSEKDINK